MSNQSLVNTVHWCLRNVLDIDSKKYQIKSTDYIVYSQYKINEDSNDKRYEYVTEFIYLNENYEINFDTFICALCYKYKSKIKYFTTDSYQLMTGNSLNQMTELMIHLMKEYGKGFLDFSNYEFTPTRTFEGKIEIINDQDFLSIISKESTLHIFHYGDNFCEIAPYSNEEIYQMYLNNV